ncbi:MAG: phosphoenolpyruvate-utilizing N-terminal domain-containing protein, partial [Gallionella sp.]|nr:phosphoenolpyruvate-utilizing N-terminal domain-containing protein [Gallionella sp.]
MSFTLHGIAVSSGIAIGHAHLVSHTSLEVAHYILPKHFIGEEIARFDAALQATRKEFSSLRSNRPTHAAAEFDAFLELHQMILDDPLLSAAPREMIANEHCNAEWALKVQTETLVAQFDEFEDAYLRERQTDVKQVAERLLKRLAGHPGHQPPPARHDIETILVAHDLSPADLIQFKPQQYAAFVTDV